MHPYRVQIKTRFSEKAFNHTIRETWDCGSFEDSVSVLGAVFNIPPSVGSNGDDKAELSEEDVEKYAAILRNNGLDEYGVKAECNHVKADYPTFRTACGHARKIFDGMGHGNSVYTTRSFSTSDGISVDVGVDAKPN